MKILFICTGNSCRSQMAEGILKSFDKPFSVHSAGVNPEKKISPFAVKVMNEIGIDISKNTTKDIKDFKDENFDYLITLSEKAKNKCEQLDINVKESLHFDIKDPFEATGNNEEILLLYRKVRNEITTVIQNIFSNVTVKN